MDKNEFNRELYSFTNVAVNNSNNFLSKLDLSLSIDWDYDGWVENDLSKAIGVYEAGSVLSGNIVIGFNVNNIWKSFTSEVKRYPWSDPYTILNEIVMTNVYHEMGHGLCEWLNDYLTETDDLDELYDANEQLFNSVLDNEEDSVEEFAWCFYDNKLSNSGLYKLIDLYLKRYIMINESIRLNSSQFHSLIRESVLRVLDEVRYIDTRCKYIV